MSIVSTRLIFVVHVVVGDVDVGRVKVDEMVYDIEPFSNYNHVSSVITVILNIPWRSCKDSAK